MNEEEAISNLCHVLRYCVKQIANIKNQPDSLDEANAWLTTLSDAEMALRKAARTQTIPIGMAPYE